MGYVIKEIRIQEVARQPVKIKQLIDLAGFKVKEDKLFNGKVLYTLCDKQSEEYDVYSDLTFVSLVEAVWVIRSYLSKYFKLIT